MSVVYICIFSSVSDRFVRCQSLQFESCFNWSLRIFHNVNIYKLQPALNNNWLYLQGFNIREVFRSGFKFEQSISNMNFSAMAFATKYCRWCSCPQNTLFSMPSRKMAERITIADVQIYLLKVVRPVNTGALTAWVGTFPKVLLLNS